MFFCIYYLFLGEGWKENGMGGDGKWRIFLFMIEIFLNFIHVEEGIELGKECEGGRGVKRGQSKLFWLSFSKFATRSQMVQAFFNTVKQFS